ncbi:MAG: hypothetical protein HC867_09750 [Bacteroidia bacterium]|nr:hypothetical protein [Bacteroidia bacterium]
MLNQLAKQYRHEGFPLVKELWKAGSLEEKYWQEKCLGLLPKRSCTFPAAC